MLVLQGLGADAVGVNCGAGPEYCEEIVKRMKVVANVPVIAKPNAGMPKMRNGETVYDQDPTTFAEGMKRLVEAGAGILGGCCGTTPEHIKAAAFEAKGETLEGAAEAIWLYNKEIIDKFKILHLKLCSLFAVIFKTKLCHVVCFLWKYI